MKEAERVRNASVSTDTDSTCPFLFSFSNKAAACSVCHVAHAMMSFCVRILWLLEWHIPSSADKRQVVLCIFESSSGSA